MIWCKPAIEDLVDLDNAIPKLEANRRFLASVARIALNRQFVPAIIHGGALQGMRVLPIAFQVIIQCFSIRLVSWIHGQRTGRTETHTMPLCPYLVRTVRL